MIPKGHNTGKWCIITDLSFPPGKSVNEGIDSAVCSLSFTSVEQVAGVVASFGRGALLAKINVKSAYRLVPVHPTHRSLKAMRWKDAVYVAVRFVICPQDLNAVADALEWHVHHQGVQHIFHYLDDFIVVGAPATEQCAEALSILDSECRRFGVPIADHKPTTCLVYLGIEVDTVALQLRLPEDKLLRLKTQLNE